ncbi:hypothetical protein Z950_827 [Sulfitobacter mediterraneus KCTC 32188]|nr:hypothetical protein Z950_827 [Sulfitobacter mediterraneus KCTC 32188]
MAFCAASAAQEFFLPNEAGAGAKRGVAPSGARSGFAALTFCWQVLFAPVGAE